MIIHTLILLVLTHGFVYISSAFTPKLPLEYRLTLAMMAFGVLFHGVSLFTPLQNCGWIYIGFLPLALIGIKKPLSASRNHCASFCPVPFPALSSVQLLALEIQVSTISRPSAGYLSMEP